MQAYGRNQSLFEPKTGSMVPGESATGNGLTPPTAPLPSNLPEQGADLKANPGVCTKGLPP
jgi:hypothetical protein